MVPPPLLFVFDATRFVNSMTVTALVTLSGVVQSTGTLLALVGTDGPQPSPVRRSSVAFCNALVQMFYHLIRII